MSDELGEQWFDEIFLKHCGPHRPQLLILDGHSSHESLAILERALEENIHILALPPHTTHHLQPLDKSVFGPFNKAYNAACSEFLQENPLHVVNKWSFPALIKTAWDKSFTVANIRSGFSACGIYPFNRNAVSESAFSPSDSTHIPLTPTSQTPEVAVTQPEPNRVSHFDGNTLNLPDCLINDPPLPLPPSPLVEPSEVVEVQDIMTNELMDLLSSGEFVLQGEIEPESWQNLTPTTENSVESTTPNTNEMFVPEANWNTDIDSIFMPPSTTAIKRETTSQRQKITSHRLLTSLDVIQEKRVLEEKKIEKESRKKKIKAEKAF